MELPLLGLAWLAAFASIGVWGAPWWLAGVTLAALVPVGARLGRRRGALLVAVAALVAFAGGIRYEWSSEARLPTLASAVPSASSVRLTGSIDSEADRGFTVTRYAVRLDTLNGQPADGRVLLSVHQYDDYLPGDLVTITGKLELPPRFETFDYRAYLLSRGILATMFRPTVARTGSEPSVARTAARAHRELEGALQRSLPEPEASLGAGIAFGRDQDLPDDLKAAFRDSGLAHLTAVSGSNVSLVAALLLALLVPLVGRRAALIPAALSVAGYVVIAGLQASVVRAGIMAVILLAGQWLGRPRSGLAALSLAAIIMTAIDPDAAREAGFQLSFSATAGLMVLQPWLLSGWRALAARHGGVAVIPDWVANAAATTLAANIATAPIVWATFGRISLVSPVANVAAQPLFALAFVTSSVTAVVGALWEPAGWWLGLVAYYPLAATAWVANGAAGLPFAAIDAPDTSAGAELAIYAIACAAGWLLYRRYPPDAEPLFTPPRIRRIQIQFAGAAAVLVGVVVVRESLLPLRRNGELVIQFLDVGQGDAALVTTPDGHTLLIDSGPSGLGLVRELGEALPHWRRTIDAVLLTHPQEDHVAGFAELFRRFEVGAALDTGVANNTSSATLYRAAAGPFRTVVQGDGWVEDGVHFEVLWPPAGYEPSNLNDTSIVLRVTYGRTSFLFTGDSEAAVHEELAASYNLRADVVKVPHHGSKTTNASFFADVRPSLAVVSVGAGNTFGHPAEQTLDALIEARVTTLRTDQNGRITIRSDGSRITFSTSR